jgi:ABC-type amino acid transport substrate-binding protein
MALEHWAGKVKVIGPISGHQVRAVAFRTTSPHLKSAFNQYFEQIWNNGTYLALVKKYYPAVVRYYPEFFEFNNNIKN